MKNIIDKSIKLLILFSGMAFLMVSCEYKEVADADYPEGKLYMPTAVNGVYTIDNVPQRIEFLPTSGQAYRFSIDNERGKFIVPLSAYRGGISSSGNITVDIIVKNDTIPQLVASSKIPAATTALPEANVSIPASVEVLNGTQTGLFNLEIDLAYLRSFPDAIFGICVGINSTRMGVNPLLKSTIIVIHTKILIPTANFAYTIDATDKSKVTFNNSSTYSMKNLWNFGNGKSDTIKSPVHFYPASGTYSVTLTAEGVLGTVNRSVKTSSITILLLPVPSFTATADAGNAKKINFTNTSTKCVSYSWNFGDGSAVSIETAPTHTYTASGTYSVVLTGTGDTGATATKTVSVTVL